MTIVRLASLPRPTFADTLVDDCHTVAAPELAPARQRQLRSTAPPFARSTVTELAPVLGTLLATASLAALGTLAKLTAKVRLDPVNPDVSTTLMALSVPILTLPPTLLYDVHGDPGVELRPIRPLQLRSHDTDDDCTSVTLDDPVSAAFVTTTPLTDTATRPKLNAQLRLDDTAAVVATRECPTTKPAPAFPRTLLPDVHTVA